MLEDTSRKAMAMSDETIALGCAGMSGLDIDLEVRLGTPVVDKVRYFARYNGLAI